MPLRPAPAAAPPSWAAWRGSGRILVIDDDTTIRTALVRSVANLGFAVDEAAEGEGGLEAFEADPRRYALVILDYRLPGMDGNEVAARLREIRPDVRLIFMSGVTREEILDGFDAPDSAGYLQKPFSLSGLVAELRGALEP